MTTDKRKMFPIKPKHLTAEAEGIRYLGFMGN